MAANLRQLRYNRTRKSNGVRASIRHLLNTPAKWNLRGELVGPDFVGLPSWWPFWSDCLKREVIEAVRAARELEAAEGRQSRRFRITLEALQP